MLKSTILALAGIVTLTATAANAGTPLINARQSNQAHRIFNGVANGNLTFRETKSLVRGQAHVARLEARAKADGFVGPLERARIGLAQNVQSARIFIKKHN